MEQEVTLSEQRPRAVVVAAGVIVPAHLCMKAWEDLKAERERQRRKGFLTEPGYAELIDTLRAVALDHKNSMRAGDVHSSASSRHAVSDIGASSEHALISTADLAGLLGCSERHALRLAEQEGITRVARGRWRREDAAVLRAARRP